jgi:2-aminoadipate transaminase
MRCCRTRCWRSALNLKGNHDFGSSSLSQYIAHQALTGGAYLSHLDTLRAGYRRKCGLMLAALERYMPKGVTWTTPHGGLYTWLTLNGTADTSRTGPIFGGGDAPGGALCAGGLLLRAVAPMV